MFIDALSMVTVKATASRKDLAGRFGFVDKIRIGARCGSVMVFVALFDVETGKSPIYMFDPADLEKRRNKPMDSKKAPVDHVEIMERLAA